MMLIYYVNFNIRNTITHCITCPNNPPSIVAVQSSQSHVLLYCLSLNSMPEATPNTHNIEKTAPIGTFLSFFSLHAFVIPAEANTPATAAIYDASAVKSMVIVCENINSTINIPRGASNNKHPIMVTETRKKFFELTPVLFLIKLFIKYFMLMVFAKIFTLYVINKNTKLKMIK